MEQKLAYKIGSPQYSSISDVEKSIKSEILEFDSRARFGISNDNSIRAIFFDTPPNSLITKRIEYLHGITSIGVDPIFCHGNPMEVFSVGCLDDLVETMKNFDLILFLANRIPISGDNLSKLSGIESLRYLRLVGNITSENVDSLCKFEQLESLTISECLELDLDLITSLVNEMRVPEIYLSSNQFSQSQIDQLRTNAISTTVRIIGDAV